MQRQYLYNTDAGAFYIVEHDGLFHPVFQGRDLGSYLTAQHAADDLARGLAFKVLRIPPPWGSPPTFGIGSRSPSDQGIA